MPFALYIKKKTQRGIFLLTKRKKGKRRENAFTRPFLGLQVPQPPPLRMGNTVTPKHRMMLVTLRS